MDRRQLATQQMQDYDLLRQALMMQQQQEADFLPTQQRYEDATTARYNKGLMGAGEAIFDAFRRKKVEPQYQQGLAEALAMKGGVDDLKARLEMLQKEREIEEERSYEQSQEAAKYDRESKGKSALQQQKDAAAMERTKARGNNPNLTYNIPAGYMPVDPSNPMAGVAPIPGSKEAMEAQRTADAANNKAINNRVSYGNLISVADKALATIGPLTTGVPGAAAAQIPGTNRKALEGYLETLKANLGFDRLQQMRAESPTGGALGQVAVQELVALQSTLASLDPNQPAEVLAENLRTVQNHYGRFLSALDGVDPDGGGDDLEAMAREAIAAGADPEAVRRRIEELKRGQ